MMYLAFAALALTMLSLPVSHLIITIRGDKRRAKIDEQKRLQRLAKLA